MVKVVSTINLKGGVGKTMMTIALAEFLSIEHKKKVLLIDLDPQTNATVSLMGETAWLTKDQRGETLLQLFKDKLEKTSKFDIKRAIVKKASNIAGGIGTLDLLPSSLGLIDIQDSLPLIPAGRFYVTSPVTILKEAISPVLDDYDFVLVDCPPNLGIITLNGIFISDYYLIPCIPDILSTYGIPQILSRVDNFKRETKIGISPLGIVISMYRAQSKLHNLNSAIF
ncbi:MAG: AAA family ATPase [Euryarchaeota archaeon]|nr:AAA family ATPase [Euryarchaeota archaeon]